MKNKETLEEFISNSNTPDGLDQFSYDKGLEAGYKWQAERMYSEEEVLTLLINFSDDRTFLKKNVATQWFKEFKKK